MILLGTGLTVGASLLWLARTTPKPDIPAARPSTETSDRVDSQVDRILEAVDLNRVSVILTPADEAAQEIPSSEWARFKRVPCGKFLHTFLGQPLSCTAEELARSCDFNPEDHPLTTNQLHSLRELIGCFRPAIEQAEQLQARVELLELCAAHQDRKGRQFGELPPCSEQERQRADDLTEAAFAKTVARLERSGRQYDESAVRRSEREVFARSLDPDRGRRRVYEYSNGSDGLIISIDVMPQTSQAYELILYHSYSMARSVASWFQNHRILDNTRGLQLEERIDSIYEEMRAYIGAK